MKYQDGSMGEHVDYYKIKGNILDKVVKLTIQRTIICCK